ncbi:MAG: WhiB family transcriptional regulator [Actinomycetota bacterium]|nr:WhiB family transcriptional regulator [Actinomycetota bacterium]
MGGNEHQDRPACAGADPALWFAERPAELSTAKAICAECPIRAQCLAGALERREPWGVWGGEIIEDGVVLEYKRGRGRPSDADRRLGLATITADGRLPRRRQSGSRWPGEVRSTAFTTPGTAGTSRSRSA